MKKYLIALFIMLSAIMAKAQTDVPTNNAISKQMPDTSQIYTAVQKTAMFPKGIDGFYKFLRKNSKYPIITDISDPSQKVFVAFIIQKDGSLTDCKIIRGVNPELDVEAIRLIKASAPWIPGQQSGYTVKQEFSIPVPFLQTKAQTVSTNKAISKQMPDTSGVYTAVEKPAMFPKGIDKLYKFFKKNSKYAVTTDSSDPSQKVFVTFIVQKDGSLTNIKIIRGVNPELDVEAIRLIKASAPWIPGQQSGYMIRQEFTVPVSFLKK